MGCLMAKVIGQHGSDVLVIEVTRSELANISDGLEPDLSIMGVSPGCEIHLLEWIGGFPGGITDGQLMPDDAADRAGATK